MRFDLGILYSASELGLVFGCLSREDQTSQKLSGDSTELAIHPEFDLKGFLYLSSPLAEHFGYPLARRVGIFRCSKRKTLLLRQD